MDLDRYFRRIGYTGPTTPTAATLHALTRAHAQSIPFENVDVLLDRPIRLGPDALYRKLVLAHRGGYCFEQNGLFLEVLRDLDFEARPLRAAVRIDEPDRSVPTGHTHLALEVRLDGESWLTDVGFGSSSLTRALRLVPDIEQVTPHDTRRLVQADGRWFHQILHGGTWTDVYAFAGESMPLSDRRIANWYTSTYPDSKFRHELMVAIALPDGGRATLHNHQLTLREADGSVRQRSIAGMPALLDVLRERFGIDLPTGTHFELAAEA